MTVFIFSCANVDLIIVCSAPCDRRENQKRHEDDSNEKLLGSQKVSDRSLMILNSL